EGAHAIKMRIPTYFTPSFFNDRILELTELSNINEGGKCRVSLDRAIGGTYIPDSNEVNYFIEVYPYSSNYFELNSKGYEIDIYTDIKKQKNFLSNFKTKNGLLYIMTAIAAKEKQLEDLLIVNEKGSILESSNSNIFLVSNGVLYTPSLEEGCLAGTMRMQIINLALQHGIKVYECSILPQNLLAAEEVFLTNSIRGIVWVGGYRTKRYFNTLGRKLQSYLNDYWENKLETKE
ncbi:MAG: 4-amino-4-deoxychorismate lyase, partial [Crocinitomicaceae bacterium]|nr:4-amino-4-deoxychorismate lyase [Crocinitomicaceae bacterium]